MSESNIPPSTGLDVYSLRYLRYIIFLSLEIMPKVPTALHLHVAQIDDITRPMEFAMTPTNLLHTHIVFDRNLQLIIR